MRRPSVFLSLSGQGLQRGRDCRENIQHARAERCQPRLARCTKTQNRRSNRPEATCCCLGDNQTFSCSAPFSKRRWSQIHASGKKGVKRFPVVTTTRDSNAIAVVNLVPQTKSLLVRSRNKNSKMFKSPPARSARTTPLHKSRSQMTEKKTAPGRPYVLHFCSVDTPNMFLRTQCVFSGRHLVAFK